MKVGIPKALLWHKYAMLWTTFLSELGAEIVMSSNGTKASFEKGRSFCLDEVCIPIKVYFGHIFELKDKVDALFVPRVVSVEKRKRRKSFTCPKMIALPDMIKVTVPGLPKMITPKIDLNHEGQFISFFKLGLSFTKDPLKIIRAYRKAVKAQEKEEKKKRDQRCEMRDGINIGVISHSYNLCGAYPTPDVEKILRRLGATPITLDTYPMDKMLAGAERQFPELSWNFEREMLGGAMEMQKDKNIDGCLIITNFACGPDSLTGDYITRLAKRQNDIPFSMITIDEHSAHAGLLTRIEAFVDMIRIKR